MSAEIAAYLNTLPSREAGAALGRCCGSSRWVERMLARLPFAGDAELFDAAEREWQGLERGDRLEAFAAHPRIGQRAEDRWAPAEQGGMARASERARAALAEANRAYEERFGHVFLICATGRSAEEMLAQLRLRLRHDPDTELEIASAEQVKITRLRLRKLVTT